MQADLIVAGSHGRTALGRLFLGSISQWLLNEARCSVRVARGILDEPDFPVRLLLALDGSRGSEKALAEIASRSWPEKSEVRVVMVDQPLELTYIGGMAPPLCESVDTFNEEQREQSVKVVKAAERKLKSAGLSTMSDVLGRRSEEGAGASGGRVASRLCLCRRDRVDQPFRKIRAR